MDEKGRQAALKKSGQKLKKLVQMEGHHGGAFILIPQGRMPYFFLDTGKTSRQAASRIAGLITGIEDQSALICGEVRYDADEQQLYLSINRVGSIKPRVKTPSKLLKNIKFIATGGLTALKHASITVGTTAYEPGEAPTTPEESVEGSTLSESAHEAFEHVDLDAEDTAEIATCLQEWAQLLLDIESILDEEDDEIIAQASRSPRLSLSDLSRTIVEVDHAALGKEARKLFSDDTALRELIKTAVHRDYNAADSWDAATLAARLLRGNGFADLIGTHYQDKLVGRLSKASCQYSVDACAVTGLGLHLEDFGCPLNHGLINVLGLRSYQTVERGGLISGSDRERRHVQQFTVSFTKFGNLLGASYKVGGGSLGSVVPHKQIDGKLHFYRGYVSDCWTYIEDVIAFAGLQAPTNWRVEDHKKAQDWEDHCIQAKVMKKLGLIGSHD